MNNQLSTTSPLPKPAIPEAITATGLRKAYGHNIVLDGIDLHVPAGTIFALLGPTARARQRLSKFSPRCSNKTVESPL